MVMRTIRRPALALVALLLVAACGPNGGSASPSTQPTPTPVGSTGVTTLDEAAAVVIASDPRFAGVTKYDPNLIGASRWWEGKTTSTGYEVTITIGWGDCPAGCIQKHVWTYAVTPAGEASLVSEAGDPLPEGSPSI
jgi:hypothetical protein